MRVLCKTRRLEEHKNCEHLNVLVLEMLLATFFSRTDAEEYTDL